jgi:uncharacterized membrane protein
MDGCRGLSTAYWKQSIGTIYLLILTNDGFSLQWRQVMTNLLPILTWAVTILPLWIIAFSSYLAYKELRKLREMYLRKNKWIYEEGPQPNYTEGLDM